MTASKSRLRSPIEAHEHRERTADLRLFDQESCGDPPGFVGGGRVTGVVEVLHERFERTRRRFERLLLQATFAVTFARFAS